MAELCEDCGKADSKGVPCYLMFRDGTDIQFCSGYEKDPKKHKKLVEDRSKVAGKEGK